MWWRRWGATPLQDAYLSGDQVMCALLERAGGMRADHPAIIEKLPAQEVKLPALECSKQNAVLAIPKRHVHHNAWMACHMPSLLCVITIIIKTLSSSV